MNNPIDLGARLLRTNEEYPLECPEYVTHVLRVIWDAMHEAKVVSIEEGNPFWQDFSNGTFECHPYDWSDNPAFDYNFKWKDIKIPWYKHFDRNMTINKPMTRTMAIEMMISCLDSLKEK